MSKIRKVLGLPAELWCLLVTWLPGSVGSYLRFHYWRRRLKILGAGTRIDAGVHIQNPEWVTIGADSWIDRNVLILAGPPRGDRHPYTKENPNFRHTIGEVVIGERTHIAVNCVLSGIGGIQIGDCVGVASGAMVYSFSHHYKNLCEPADKHQYSFTPLARPDQQAMVLGPVVLEDHTAVGLNAVVLPGVTLGRGSWLGCSAVLAKDVPDQTVVSAGADAKTKSLADLTVKV